MFLWPDNRSWSIFFTTAEQIKCSNFLSFWEEGDREKFQFSHSPNLLSARPGWFGLWADRSGGIHSCPWHGEFRCLSTQPAPFPGVREFPTRVQLWGPRSDERIEANSSKGQADMWPLGDFTGVWNFLNCNSLLWNHFYLICWLFSENPFHNKLPGEKMRGQMPAFLISVKLVC